MVAPAGKQPRHQMTPAQRKLQLEVQRRERHRRRSTLADERQASIKVRAALQAEEKAVSTSVEAIAVVAGTAAVAAEPKETRRPLRTPKPAAKAMRGPGLDNTRRELDGGDISEEQEEDATGAVDASAADVAVPTSSPTSQAVAVPDPTSTPTSRPRSRDRQKRRRTGSSESEVESSGAEEDEDDDDEAARGGGCTLEGDLCMVINGDAAKDTMLNSDDDESSSGDSSSDEGDAWELIFDSEEEGNAAEELPSSRFLETAKKKAVMKEMRYSGWEYDSSKFGPDPTYEDLYAGPYGPSASVLRVAEDPLALFFYFLQAKLWRKIEMETNKYHVQNIRRRSHEIQRNQRKGDTHNVETLNDIRARLSAVQPVQVWELLRVIGLLIARMLAPQVRRIPAHWVRAQRGAIPAGTFGQWLPRHRFEHVTQNLHFTDNKALLAHQDRGWKVRSVVTTLQKTFARGYIIGPAISFDEAIIPTRARRNPTRQYLPKKPHKWGTKFFSACCADTAYCMRIEMYVGAKNSMVTPVPVDNSAGASAVMRSMNVLLPPSPTAPFRIVITDRYYTSVVLALELLHRRLYFSGTIMTNRSGYAAGVMTEKKAHKNRPSEPPRGTVKLAQNKIFPQMTAAMWMDNNPVHMLSTGGSRQFGDVLRGVGRTRENFPAPGLVRDYQRWMGGVDVHDQLRMQRYSIQLAYKPKKYYRSLFFGLVDMALVNAFIVHRYHLKTTGQKATKHYKFLQNLHEQLLAVDAAKFEEIEAATRAEDRTAASPHMEVAENVPDEVHYLAECPDMKETKDTTEQGEPKSKRRARSCKVCALYRVKPRKYSKWFCVGRSNGEIRKHLCNVVREGRTKTCFQIYHSDWKNGEALPPRLSAQHRLQDRRPGPQRKRRRRRVDMEEGEQRESVTTVEQRDDEDDRGSEEAVAAGEEPHARGGSGGASSGSED